LIPIAGTDIEGVVGAILNSIQKTSQQQLQNESNNTGSPFFDTGNTFGGIDVPGALILLSELLEPLLGETELEFEPDEDGNYPPIFLLVEPDTTTPPPIAETDGPLTANGTLTVLDPNLPDSVTTEVISVEVSGDTNGLVSDNPAILAMLEVVPGLADADVGDQNNVFWTFNSGTETFDYLGHDETLTLTYLVRATDGPGATDDVIFIFVIDGTNDTPEISNVIVTKNDAIEDEAANNGPLTGSGSFTFFDPDLRDTIDSSVSMTGFQAQMNTDVLPEGGLQDALDALEAELASAVTLSGQTIDALGGVENTVNWNFELDNDLVQFLAEGETITVVYRIAVKDDSLAAPTTDAYGEVDTAYQDVTITITGTNDAPVIDTKVSQARTITETVDNPGGTDADPADVTGTIEFTDVDLSDQPTASITNSVVTTANLANGYTLTQTQIDALLNAFSLDDASDGVTDSTFNDGVGGIGWTYDATNAAIDFLGATDQVVLTFTVQVDDNNGGTDSQDVVITINGTNDKPVITSEEGVAGIDRGAITEVSDGGTGENTVLHSQSGTIAFGDVDISDIHTLTVTPDAGNPTDLTVSFTTTDPTTTGSTATGSFGWEFTVNDMQLDFLAEGETREYSYTLTVDDGNGGTDSRVVTIVVTGSNDAPAISVETGDSTGDTLDETDAGLTANGTLTTTDVDRSDTVTAQVVSVTPSGDTTGIGLDNTTLLGMLTLTAGAINADAGDVNNLAWAFNSGTEAFDYLAAGESLTLTYQVQVTDDSGVTDNNTSALQTITIVIKGTNDAPVIESVSVPAPVAEELFASSQLVGPVTGTINVSDKDAGNTLTATHGTATATWSGGTTLPTGVNLTALTTSLALIISSTTSSAGTSILSWTYDPNSVDLDWLAAGETLTISYSFTVSDGTATSASDTISIVIHGTNDLPIAENDGALVEESATVTIDVLANDTDPDATDILSVQSPVSASGAAVKVNDDGSLNYVANGTYTFVDGFATDTVTYQLSDGTETVTGTVTVIINQGEIFDFVLEDFSGFSGSNEQKTLNLYDMAGGSAALFITAFYLEDPAFVDSRKTDIGVRGDQGSRRISSGEGLNFAFLAPDDNGLQPGAENYEPVYLATTTFGAQILLQNEGSASVSITIRAYDLDGQLMNLDATHIQVISDNATAPVISDDPSDPNALLVTGLTSGDSFILELDPSTPFGSIEVANSGTEGEFTLGLLGIDIAQYQEGTVGDDTLVGTIYDDVLIGLGGDDLLIGGAGDDILIGGPGADVLRGGPGSDTFVLDDTAFTGVDTIEDYLFVQGGEEDIVDITALLDVAGGSRATSYI
jgi:VCBS repeat-containing protein